MSKIYTPILAGISQYTQRKNAEKPLDPLSLMARVCREAIDDAGVGGIKEIIDTLHVVNLFQWPYRDAPGMLCGKLGIDPKERSYLPIGGNTPQLLVNRACRVLASGRTRAVLITGAEAIYSIRRALKGEIALDWPESKSPERIDGTEVPGVSNIEAGYDLFFPSVMYPLFETAIREASGRSPDEHRHYMARLWEKFSQAAAGNPHAWMRKPLSAAEIAEVTPENRYISYPYTKHMNANINVDQAAAVLLTTSEVAEELGIGRDKWVYPLGGADFNDIWNVSRRPRLDSSPAVRNASRLALAQAGLRLDDIDIFDLYSCFPSAVEIAMKEIGIAEDDPRPLSLTGGLAFFGGPGNNYSLHAIASAADAIRQDRSKEAMVTANGWYITKHSIGIYGGEPPVNPWTERDDSLIQHEIDAAALPEPVEKAQGELAIEAYVIRHGSKGEPVSGTVIGRLSDGSRALAHLDAQPDELLAMERTEMVGKRCRVEYSPEIARNFIKYSEFS